MSAISKKYKLVYKLLDFVSYNLQIVLHLLKHGAKVNVRDSYGDTPLHLSCYKGCKDSVDCLLMVTYQYFSVSKHTYTFLFVQSCHPQLFVIPLSHFYLYFAVVFSSFFSLCLKVHVTMKQLCEVHCQALEKCAKKAWLINCNLLKINSCN